MIAYNYFGKEQKLYYEKLENGLEIFILPNHNSKLYHIDVVTRYGSDISSFVPLGEKKEIRLPLGIAHFLEHKMFDMPDFNSFDYYAKTGTYINAGTNYISTRYYMDGKKNYQKNLDEWLRMIYTPHFLDDSVNKEKNIIAEEIKMYDDEPVWTLDYENKKCLYNALFQEKIAGTVESIQQINADILKKTYDVFYQPSNMFIVITGNVPIKETIKIIKSNEALIKRPSNNKIICDEKKEDVKVRKEYSCIYDNVVLPKLTYSFKFNLNDFDIKDKPSLIYYLNIIFSNLFGEASSFNEKIINDQIATNFYIDHIIYDNIYTFTLVSESEYADLFKEMVDKELSKIIVSSNDFERIKKVITSVIIRSLDNTSALASSIVDSILKREYEFDVIASLSKLNYNDLLKIIDKLDFSNHSFVLMLPKE